MHSNEQAQDIGDMWHACDISSYRGGTHRLGRYYVALPFDIIFAVGYTAHTAACVCVHTRHTTHIHTLHHTCFIRGRSMQQACG